MVELSSKPQPQVGMGGRQAGRHWAAGRQAGRLSGRQAVSGGRSLAAAPAQVTDVW